MAAPIGLREDFNALELRRIAKRSKDGPQARRLLALASTSLRFNVHGPEGLRDRKAPGAKPRLNDEQRAALTAMLERGPIPAIHGVVRWRIADLRQWVFEEFRFRCRTRR